MICRGNARESSVHMEGVERYKELTGVAVLRKVTTPFVDEPSKPPRHHRSISNLLRTSYGHWVATRRAARSMISPAARAAPSSPHAYTVITSASSGSSSRDRC